MPLPLAPLIPLAVRLGLVATTTWAVTRWIRSATHPGRTDQRAEDALDDLGEGLTLHRPVDRVADNPGDRQTNATARVRRVVRFRGRSYEFDAGLMARLRVRATEE
ncbi:hypothetical protein [Tabrizicola sp.]|uniref:hypothetical protein n=1 Tax=Tabrizicola sp. TaxID=2005166 RepID=UPI00273748AD|nr:hypothetical protein [Tabrizicola sp.]MDP3193934.1 hypothetical protein [Tabrizicola sp.]